MFLQPMKEIFDVLGLEKKGLKDELSKRLMTFLFEPKDNGKKVPQPKKSRYYGGN